LSKRVRTAVCLSVKPLAHIFCLFFKHEMASSRELQIKIYSEKMPEQF